MPNQTDLKLVYGSPIWLIAAERERQQSEEGWTPEHDDQHVAGEMAVAAACYALPSREREQGYNATPGCNHYTEVTRFDKLWPWDRKWWKPTPKDRKREIIKACALLVAEYERLSRAQ